MAPTGMKRPAAAAAGARKKRAVDPSIAQCKLVAEALADAPLVESVKKMLSQGVPSSLGVYADERHDYQKTLVGMLGEVLVGVGDCLSARKAAAQAKVEGSDADKAARDAAAAAAEEALAAATAIVAERRAALADADAALTTAKKILKDAEVAQKMGNEDLAKAAAAKETLDAATTKLHAIKETGGAAGDVKEILSVAKKNGCDENLLLTLPEVLKKDASSRGTFDGIALKELEAFYVTAVGACAAKLADGEASNAQLADTVVAAGAALGAAADGAVAGKGVLGEATSAEKEALAALKAAKEAVKNFVPEAKAAAAELARATHALEAFTCGALAAFGELKQRTKPVPEPEPEALAPKDPEAPAMEAPAVVEAVP